MTKYLAGAQAAGQSSIGAMRIADVLDWDE